jgi:hypothetical protein
MSVLKIWLANTVKQTMLARIAQFKKKSGWLQPGRPGLDF